MSRASSPLIEPTFADDEAPSSARVGVGTHAQHALGDGALIVVPTYDERANLEQFVSALRSAAPLAHVLIVDDNSPDGTGQLADSMAAHDPLLSVLHRPRKLGLGTAYVAGFRWGLGRGFQSFLEMDADFSHDPTHLAQMFEALGDGADLVIGSRNVSGGRIQGWGIGRLLLSQGGSLYSRLVLGQRVRDFTSGYKAFDRRALESLNLELIHSNGYAFQIEMTYRVLQAGLKVVETPITFVDRRVGQSKMDRGIFLEAMGVVWRLRLDALRGRL